MSKTIIKPRSREKMSRFGESLTSTEQQQIPTHTFSTNKISNAKSHSRSRQEVLRHDLAERPGEGRCRGQSSRNEHH
jgi:hypothetical protein